MELEPSQIAFLFLTRGEVNNIEIWENYFKDADPKKYKLFIHPKDEMYLTSSLWKGDNSTVLRPIPTAWGTVSLVRATLYLLHKAIVEPRIKKFMLVSETCLPMTSFNSFYEHAMSDSTSSIHWTYGRNIDRMKIVNHSMNWNITTSTWAKQSQWMLLDRTHVEHMFSQNNPNSKCTSFLNGFQYCPAADEHFFINYLLNICKCDIKHITNKPITYVNWNTGSQHPMLFSNLDEEMINYCRNQKIFFARKFLPLRISPSSIDYLLERNGSVSRNNQVEDKETQPEDAVPLTAQQEELLKIINKHTIMTLTDQQIDRIMAILKEKVEEPVVEIEEEEDNKEIEEPEVEKVEEDNKETVEEIMEQMEKYTNEQEKEEAEEVEKIEKVEEVEEKVIIDGKNDNE
jgi:hypothetical protein